MDDKKTLALDVLRMLRAGSRYFPRETLWRHEELYFYNQRTRGYEPNPTFKWPNTLRVLNELQFEADRREEQCNEFIATFKVGPQMMGSGQRGGVECPLEIWVRQ